MICRLMRKEFCIFGADNVSKMISKLELLYTSIYFVTECVKMLCVCVRGSIIEWLKHWPDNQKVPGLVPSCAKLLLSSCIINEYLV